MYDIFKTVLILSLFGFGITALLLLLKPITAKRLPARWQYCVWVALLISMVLPAYKLIPKKEAQKLSIVTQNQTVHTTVQPHEDTDHDTVVTYDTPIEYREVNLSPKIQIRLFDLIAYIWGAGVLIFLLVVMISYFRFLCHKNKNAVKISDNNMRMVLLHELTHYKRKDLLVKWFAILVNAVHWFNPLCYLACAALSEACEVSCDMSATKNMSEDEQKLYMQTILNLVEERS